MTPIGAPLAVNGAELIARPSGALWWPLRKILVVADLHLEKASAFARTGRMLPPYDSAETLLRLSAEITALKPKQVIALGDSFHDRHGPARLPSPCVNHLTDLVRDRDWLWIAGNHDPAPQGPWGGSVAEQAIIGPLVFRHDATPGSACGEVSGHYHPKAAIRMRGQRYSARCFASDARRLILPAFGAFTGGLDVLDPTIAGLFGAEFWAYLTAPDRVLAVPRHRLS